MSTFKVSNTQVNSENVAAAIASDVTTETLIANNVTTADITTTGDITTTNILAEQGYNTYQTLGTQNVVNPPSNTLTVGGVNISALNKRTRTSYASAERCVSTWTSRTSASGNYWLSVCWAPELSLFCAVSDFGFQVMTSPDGITWTGRTPAADNQWNSVCWAPELSLFCAVADFFGSGDQVMTSPDGITWTTRTPASDNQWRSVCWAPELSLFCAVGYSESGDGVMTSPDGITWTSRTAPDDFWLSVCWAPELSLFCVVSSRVMTSPDGITWTARAAASDNNWWSLCWAPELSLFCAVAEFGSGDRVMTSPDGITWTARTPASDNSWFSVCWAPELSLFCAVSSYTGGVMTSPDGIIWTSRIEGSVDLWSSVCWAPELSLFSAVGDGVVMTSAIAIPNSLSTVKAPPSQITVTPTGNVGVATAVPTEKLHVTGNILATGTVTPFTGAHVVQNIYNTKDLGKIVSSTGYISNIELNNAFPITEIASKAQDPSVYGVLSEIKESTALVNGVGEGALWVCDIGGSISKGDFITSSTVIGYGEKQSVSGVQNYTVARAIMNCVFDPEEIKEDFVYTKTSNEITKKVETDFDLKTTEIAQIQYYIEYLQDETMETITVYDSDGDFVVEKVQEVDSSDTPKSVVVELTTKVYKSGLRHQDKKITYERVPLLDSEGVARTKTLLLEDDITKEAVSADLNSVEKFIVYTKEYREWSLNRDSEGNPVTKSAYETRYVNSDGVEIGFDEYTSLKATGGTAHICALIGCIYLCG